LLARVEGVVGDVPGTTVDDEGRFHEKSENNRFAVMSFRL